MLVVEADGSNDCSTRWVLGIYILEPRQHPLILTHETNLQTSITGHPPALHEPSKILTRNQMNRGQGRIARKLAMRVYQK